ncbi:MAG: tetratricopeptide repeat protein [gamma proteobacterium endosymbiont of Lamellibrachia anaximandri]|nr:tetratricopeptide repeat protein [gamma proteobacterium endosymbiont of Lamellibrachia anaximandri]MBL3535130.1 tetratricopeptide repeat protein [gamma proteobacterium endosymbiont of Lamellibrachia anaximandri]
MTTDVFISYAHAGGAKESVRKLERLLSKAGLDVFLDEREIPFGSPFPHDISEALLESRQVVLFIDSAYFTRPWCVYEFQAVTAPYRAAKVTDDSLLEHVTVVLPGEGDIAALIPHLPPSLAKVSWPSTDQAESVAELVQKQMGEYVDRLRTRLSAVNDDSLDRLRSGGDIPLAWAASDSAGLSVELWVRPLSIDLAPETRAEEFIGRAAELWRVFHHLVTCRPYTSVRSCGIQGAGGSGKSQLAAEFVARYGACFFPGGIVWINADGDLQTLISQFRRVLSCLAPDEADPSTGIVEPEQQRDTLALALAEHCKAWPNSRQMLWVIDGVPEPASGEKSQKLDYWCPVLRHVNLLTTSRRTGVGHLDAYINLGGLALSDAVDWLTRPEVDRQWLKESEWKDLARWVGSLPMAIALLRTSLMDGYTTTQALQLAQSHEPSLMLDREMDALRGEVEDERLRGVTEAFDFSYRALARDPALQHAAHLVACLAPYPLADHLLSGLISAPLTGKLARRSWLQVSLAKGSGRTRRHYVMHRIPASFLRSRMPDPDALFSELFSWLGRSTQASLADTETRALDYHLMVIQRRFTKLLDTLPNSSSAVKIARDFAVQAASKPTDSETRGFRYLAAKLANMLGAGDEVAERLEQLYDAGDSKIAAAIPHALQALRGSGKAGGLMARLLEDKRATVTYQAIVHAGALADLALVLPMLEAVLHTSMEHADVWYGIYLHNDCPELTTILSHLARYLNEGNAKERERAAALLGRALQQNGSSLQAGGFTSRHLVGGLLRVACEDDSPDVVDASVTAASVYFDKDAYDKLINEFSVAASDDQRARILSVMGDYLFGTQRPAPPKILQQEIMDEGGMRMEIDLGSRAEPLPEGIYGPFIEVVTAEDNHLAHIAVKGLMRTNAGNQVLADTAHRLLDQQAYESMQLLAGRVIENDPEFINGYWWRGQSRQALGDSAEALMDITRVIDQMPDFIDAYYWRGQAREMQGDTTGALEDYTRVIEEDPDFIHAYYYRGLLRMDMDDPDGALSDFSAVITQSDDFSDAFYRHGQLLSRRQAFDQALLSLQRAADLEPESFHAHHMVAFCLYNLQRYEEAGAAASRAIDIDPDVGETWFFRGIARYAAGRAEESLEDIRRAVKLDPSDERSSLFMARLEEYLGVSG